MSVLKTSTTQRSLARLLQGLVLTLLLSKTCFAAQPITIGTTQSLTGHFSEFGEEQLRGLQMWADDVNARGALLGRPVALKYYDDRSRDAGTVEGFQKLIAEDGVDLLVGPYSSSLTLEASLVAQYHGIPMVACAASSEEIWNRGLNYIFGIDTPSRHYAAGPALARSAGAKTMSLIYAETEFGIETASALRRQAVENGLDILVDQVYPPEQRDFKALALRMKAANTDLVMGASSLEDSIAIVEHLSQHNFNPKMLAFTVGPALHEFGDALGEKAEGVVGIVQWLRSVPVPGAEDFAYRYRKRYGNDPGVYAVIGYSAGQILEAAVRLAGTTDHDAVRDQLSTMFFRSLLGKYQVDETGRQEGKRNYILQWQNGERRLVSPQRMAERELIYPRKLAP